MVLDRLENTYLYENLSENFRMVFHYLQKNDLKKLAVGKYTLENGVYFMVQQYATKPVEAGKWEAHRKYIDIQLVLDGNERIGYAPITGLEEATAYEEEADVQFFEGEGSLLQVPGGSFCIFFPEDAHMPGIRGTDNVPKIVVKIPVE